MTNDDGGNSAPTRCSAGPWRRGRRARRLTVVTAVVLAAAGIGAPAVLAAGTFLDDDGNPHEEMIEVMAARGITSGCTAAGDRYCPGLPVTRGQMATFLVRTLQSEGAAVPTNPPNAFPDDAGSVHERNIDALAAMGIVAGSGDGRYHPANVVTRGQMALFIDRAFQLPTPAAGSSFVDVPEIYREAVGAMAEAGITSGCNPDGSRYCPGEAVRRDQMASFLGRALRNGGPSGPSLPPGGPPPPPPPS